MHTPPHFHTNPIDVEQVESCLVAIIDGYLFLCYDQVMSRVAQAWFVMNLQMPI
jgi:hypothetical protein